MTTNPLLDYSSYIRNREVKRKNVLSILSSYCEGKNMTINIRRVLIEALKARETSLVELSQAICSATGVEECDMVVTDVDAKTETVKLTVRGSNIEYSGILSILQDNGVSVKGVDEVSVSKVKLPLQRPAP
ncbi:MAG TPA: DUF211 domain-containing protein [Candidatus Deferrimicrobiaceae bacterium]|nr:DUF211 domain-containing protein [Candidatus Deferrimicrobiaceae bacterium]